MDQSLITATDLSVLHDWELAVVAMDRAQRTLRLGFTACGQTQRTILFRGVITQRINNVQFQNVVSRVLVSGSTDDLGDELERVLRWMFSGSEDKLLISEQYLQKHLARVRSGELRVLYVDPSWGAEIGVLAEGYQVSE